MLNTTCIQLGILNNCFSIVLAHIYFLVEILYVHIQTFRNNLYSKINSRRKNAFIILTIYLLSLSTRCNDAAVFGVIVGVFG